MNVVAIRSLSAESRAKPVADSRIARIEIFDDLTAAEPHWRALERGHRPGNALPKLRLPQILATPCRSLVRRDALHRGCVQCLGAAAVPMAVRPQPAWR